MIKSCYVHIPFCEKICSYCDFCKMFYNKKIVDKYLDSLEEEIHTLYNGEELETLYIGGGTPSSLNIEQLERLFEILNIFEKNKKIEFTIECNFSNIDKEKLELFKKYGVNRLSFGLETTSKKQLDFLERREDLDNTRNIIKLAKNMGFNNINVDLIYGIPGEKTKDLKKDLELYHVKLEIQNL